MSELQAMRIDVPETEYHADPCEAPSLSSSLAKVLLSRSPLHAWHTHPRLGHGEREDKDTYDRGHLLHKLVLGKGREVEVIEASDYRTKAAQEAKAIARADNKIPVLRDKYDEAVVAAGVIVDRLKRIGIELSGESEVQIAWQELSNHGPVWCRAMIDHVIEDGDRAIIYDLKSCASAHTSACAKAILNYGYDVQQAAYTRALRALRPSLRTVDFVFLFAEHQAPHGVNPGRLDDTLRMRGEEAWTRAVIDFGENCREPGEWPGYTKSIVTFEAPGWLLANEVEIGFEEG